MTPRNEADSEVVRLDDVTVDYRVAVRRSLKETAIHWMRMRPRLSSGETNETTPEDSRRADGHFRALDSLSLSVRAGEIVGVIGPNGAGKTTLLRLVGRILAPTSGRVRLRGRVAALIDLVGGFHPELTGRENLFFQGALAGLTRRDVSARIDDIAEFAAVGAFLDAPLRTYSSGMILRLAFALMTSVDADVLLIDEALAVGDTAFQKKCLARLDEYRANGVTFIVVSHDILRLRELADRILWLDAGRIRLLGAPELVVARYIESLT